MSPWLKDFAALFWRNKMIRSDFAEVVSLKEKVAAGKKMLQMHTGGCWIPRSMELPSLANVEPSFN